MAKLETWIQSAEGKAKVAAEEDFGKRVFRMFRRGKLPDVVIAEVGRVDEVMSLWEKYLKLREGDYYRCLSTLSEYGWEVDQNSEYPASEQLEYILSDYVSSSEEKRLIVKVVEETGLTEWVGKPGILSPLDAVKRLAEGFNYALNKVAGAR